ncbi:MAG: hypothetical protein JRH11_01610 [Deltaproteobacteria bacterium]|nr:hypothetical protein [Deltaproteobacteria bacterium]
MRWLALVAFLFAGCGDEPVDPPPPPPEMPEELTDFFETLLVSAEAFDEVDGQWTEDYGDAPFYGPAIYSRLAAERGDAEMGARAERARGYGRAVLERAIDDRDWYLANMEEALMAALGLVEYAAASEDQADVPLIDSFVDETNQLIWLFGNYLPTGAEIGSFALTTYGPTSITGGAALLNLQYAYYLDTPRRQDRIDTAQTMVAAIDRNAWDGTRYLFEPDEEKLYLYPNTMMMLVLCRLAELAADESYLAQAVTVADAIAPLRAEERGGYRSPYSAEYMGAETDDYSTLSSQNYLALAFTLLYAQTRQQRFFDEAIFVLDLGRTRLYDAEEGKILHHWMDGRIAQPEDREYWCSGCTLQYLYVVWYLAQSIPSD